MSDLIASPFQPGGALRANSIVYVKRGAEEEAVQQLRKMAYLKIIEPRQQGKNSLINWLKGNLQTSGYIFAVADVSTLDQSSQATWYSSLSDRLLRQVNFVLKCTYINLPTTATAWRTFLAELADCAGKANYNIVIALDEIGTTYQGWAEPFFRVLRDVFNNRENEPYFDHLTFILAGCYDPASLIQDNNESPFNVAVRLRLPDFTQEQVSHLVAYLRLPKERVELITKRIYYWTDGQPYMTQLLCHFLAIHNQPTDQVDVDNAVQRLRREDKNHLHPILLAIRKNPTLRKYIARILQGNRIYFLPDVDSRHATLELIGAIKADANGHCIIRNLIYAQSFTEDSDEETIGLTLTGRNSEIINKASSEEIVITSTQVEVDLLDRQLTNLVLEMPSGLGYDVREVINKRRFAEMFQTPEEIDKEIEHQQSLYRSNQQNLHYIEDQIAMFAGLAPIHLLRQRDLTENELGKILQKTRELEQQKSLPVSVSAKKPEVSVHLLFTSLPVGVLHLYSHSDLPMFKYNVINSTDTTVSIVLSSWIEQFSYKHYETVSLTPGQKLTVGCLPTLKLDEVKNIYEVRKVVLHTRAVFLEDGRESLLFDQSYDAQLLARDVITWAIIDDNSVHDLSYQIAAWVTPNVPSVVDMLRFAADYYPTKQLWGYQDDGSNEQHASKVRAQIKAIFQALKEKGNITYIHSPISFGQKDKEVQQRINLPQYSLTHHQANCMDGAVLYASLIERAAMKPVIVIIPGHAFVGWETWENSGQYEFLETTMTVSDTFEKAFEKGMQEFEDVKALVGRPLFDPNGFAVMLKIQELHKKGILPVE